MSSRVAEVLERGIIRARFETRHWRVSGNSKPFGRFDHVLERGVDLFTLVCDADLEGVVAKWKLGRYMPEDCTSWVKTNNPNYTQVIGRDKMFEKLTG